MAFWSLPPAVKDHAGILTPGIDWFRPSFYGRPIHHGCGEQIFGVDEQDSGRGQSDQDVLGPDAMIPSGEGRMLKLLQLRSANLPRPSKGWGLSRRPARHLLRVLPFRSQAREVPTATPRFRAIQV